MIRDQRERLLLELRQARKRLEKVELTLKTMPTALAGVPINRDFVTDLGRLVETYHVPAFALALVVVGAPGAANHHTAARLLTGGWYAPARDIAEQLRECMLEHMQDHARLGPDGPLVTHHTPRDGLLFEAHRIMQRKSA